MTKDIKAVLKILIILRNPFKTATTDLPNFRFYPKTGTLQPNKAFKSVTSI